MKSNLAQQLFDEAFNTNRDPRSDAYKRGVLDALKFRSGEITNMKQTMPYELGTAECDAWSSGTDEGYGIWRRHKDSAEP